MKMAKTDRKGVKHIISSAGFSLAGLVSAVKNETAFRQELILFAILMPVSFWIGRSVLEEIMLIGSCLVVMIAELLNSAIEAAIDRIGDEYHILSKQAKDMGSAAVFLSLILLATVWIMIMVDRFIK